MRCVRTSVLCFYVFILRVFAEVAENGDEDNNLAFTTGDQGDCVMVDGLCLPVEDLSSYEAIKSLHRLLDDDKSGEIDMNESVDFLKEELTITDGYNSRQKNLHNNSDRFISVQDLWHLWKRSEVHNWTVAETVQWMSETVGLPQYADTIVSHAINGSYLPSLMKLLATSRCHELQNPDTDRLTMNKSNYLGAELGIKGLSHRTKVTVKAMDAVLFGPPKVSRTKDLLIACLITVILIGLGYVIVRNHKMRGYHNRLIMQIEELQLEESKYRMHLSKIKEKASESPAPDAAEGPDNGVLGDISDMSSTHEDSDGYEGRVGSSEDAPDSLDQGGCYDDDYSQTGGSGTPPHMSEGQLLDRASLVHWLQVTYQKEKNVIDAKRRKAHQEFNKANDICQKLRAQGKNPLNLFSLMHGKMDNVEKTISNARATMQSVQRDEAERQERWGEIERLLECNIRQRAELHSIMGSFTSLQTATSPTESSNIVGKLLSSQSALMFLTMGGYPALTGSGADHRSAPSSTTCNSTGGQLSSNTCIITTASSSPLPHSSPYSTITSQQLQQQLWSGTASRGRPCNSVPPPAAAESRSSNALRAAIARSPPAPPPSLVHHGSSVSSEFGGRCEDEGDSISLPRCSSVSSSTAGSRLPSSSSHQQLSDQLSSTTTGDGSSSSNSHQTSRPPQKKPRRVRPTSGKTSSSNGLVPSGAGTTAATAATIIEATNNNPPSPNSQCSPQPPALFSVGGSPPTVPPCSAPPTPQSEAPAADLLTGGRQAVQQLSGGVGVSSSSSDPALNSKAVSSHHRTLSQLPPSPTDPKLSSSKVRNKKKSFFERLTSPRKSFQIKASKT